jgi:hypothetical protein
MTLVEQFTDRVFDFIEAVIDLERAESPLRRKAQEHYDQLKLALISDFTAMADEYAKAADEITRLRAERDALVGAVEQAISFENEDTECAIGHDPYVPDEICPDGRCATIGCMVMHVNRWRALLARVKAEEA